MAKGIYERKGLNGDVTYYIRYQVDGTDIKERVGRKSRGFTREMERELKIVRDVKRLNVARDGIEPPTRRFSVSCSTD